ncbi:MAG: oxidoreductase domain protein [Chthoniobacteraceae bacterium]|nr:oxidoreductase domain protein [Chthoniobacteraceae bacterium]
MNSHLTRRRFLTQSAGLAAATVLGPNLLLRGQETAGRRLNLAVIGAFGKGEVDTGKVALAHNIVALVDVDSKRLESAGKALSKKYTDAGREVPQAPRLFADFRKMFDQMAGGIDGVIVSTPDHTHFPAAMWAIKNKKHVCVQKPLCNTIWEIRELHQAAKQAGVVTQMGNQGRTMEGQRVAKEWIDQGAIGTLQEIRLWTNRPIWPQGALVKSAVEKPATLEWDLWLATEAEEPYFEFDLPPGAAKGKQVHPFNWRGWWQFGSGALGDMGCHLMDAAFSILGQQIPVKIEVESSKVTDLTAPVWTRLTYHFAATDKHGPLKVTWHDGVGDDGKPNKPERDERLPKAAFDKSTSGMMFIGSEGVLFDEESYCANPVIYPEERFADVKKSVADGRIKKTEPRSSAPDNPQGEWANCILNGGTPSSNFDYAAPLTEFVSLGNLAIRSGQTIQWDAKAMRVTNNDAANQFIKRASYRPGWL